MNRLIAGWQTAFATPAIPSSTRNTGSERASSAHASISAAVATTQPRIARSAPVRSLSRPPGPAPTAPAAKKTVTPDATAPTLTSRSALIWSASEPTRNPGSTVAAPAAIASAAGRARLCWATSAPLRSPSS